MGIIKPHHPSSSITNKVSYNPSTPTSYYLPVWKVSYFANFTHRLSKSSDYLAKKNFTITTLFRSRARD